jgi:mono/diheme cytochrome c family protein
MKKTATLVLLFTVSCGMAMADGKAAYDASCKKCHGPDGVANPMMAKMMKVEMKDLGSADVQGHSDADIKKIIVEGKGKMKATANVTPAIADQIVAYVRTFKK